jgi:hypothetical protein
MSIFVAIAAYRDPRLWRTVHDCLAKAADPSALRFGVVEQSDGPSQPDRGLVKHLRYVHVHHNFSRGVCWARAIVFGLYEDEDFLLQIDSHMVFAPNWDRTLIAWLEALSRPEPRSVISTYPFGFTEVDGQAVVNASLGEVLVLRPRMDSDFNGSSPELLFEGIGVKSPHPIIGCHIAAGCVFTRGAFVDAVPYDARLYFHGEEQNLAIRAWTQGWNLFHIPDLPIFHLYKRPSAENAVHWNAADDAARDFRFADLKAQSEKRLRELLVLRRDLGRYGLGTVRSLSDFAAFSGIDYPNLRLRRIPAQESLDLMGLASLIHPIG